MKNNILILIVLFNSFAVFGQTKFKKFPKFLYLTTTNDTISNHTFSGKQTLIIIAHIGSPPAMELLKDLQEAEKSNISIPTTYLFLENSEDQVTKFNEPTRNLWSSIRAAFKLNPILLPTVCECSFSKGFQKNEAGQMALASQCQSMGKKLKVKSSPALIFVNEKGRIVKIIEGYTTGTLDERIKFLQF